MVAGGDNYPQDVSRVVELYDLTSDLGNKVFTLTSDLDFETEEHYRLV